MADYKLRCWFCGAREMEDLGEYSQCRTCGATYTVMPPPGGDPRWGKSTERDYFK